MVVTVDERRHHGLARQIHANGALWRLSLTLLADPREALAFDEEYLRLKILTCMLPKIGTY